MHFSNPNTLAHSFRTSIWGRFDPNQIGTRFFCFTPSKLVSAYRYFSYMFNIAPLIILNPFLCYLLYYFLRYSYFMCVRYYFHFTPTYWFSLFLSQTLFILNIPYNQSWPGADPKSTPDFSFLSKHLWFSTKRLKTKAQYFIVEMLFYCMLIRCIVYLGGLIKFVMSASCRL